MIKTFIKINLLFVAICFFGLGGARAQEIGVSVVPSIIELSTNAGNSAVGSFQYVNHSGSDQIKGVC